MSSPNQQQAAINARLMEIAEKSIAEAKDAMQKVETNISKNKASKDSRSKALSAASKIVSVMLDPAAQVAQLLNGAGNMYPPLGIVGGALTVLVNLETERRTNDARIVAIFPELADTLIVLGAITPAFIKVTSLTNQLEAHTKKIKQTMLDFGTFSEAYYKETDAKAVLLHLFHASKNKSELAGFRERLTAHRADLHLLLSSQSTLLSAHNSVHIGKIDKNVESLVKFFTELSDENEDQAVDFVKKCGGEEAVQNNDRLLDQFASKFGKALTPYLRSVIKSSAHEILEENQAVFTLKYEFAMRQVATKVEDSREMILNEMRSGPYELIIDPDVKNVWKNTSAKESSVKRRMFIDGLSYYFRMQFKSYKAEHHVDRDDAWTHELISKVHYHPAIGDAIDEDASGYISVLEANDFLRNKPANWTVPQYIAYWAHGWDADNYDYQSTINKALAQLKKLQEKPGPNANAIQGYLDIVKEPVTLMANSCYPLPDLSRECVVKMDKLRKEWTDKVETTIKAHLKILNYTLEYSSVTAVAGSERIEATILPILALLISRHVSLFSKGTAIDESQLTTAKDTIQNLESVFSNRIFDLHNIWRRQRIDVDMQFKYYANGLFEDFFKANRKRFDSDVETEESEWDSDDEWDSNDDKASGDENATATDATASSAPPAAPAVRSLPQQRQSAPSPPVRTASRGYAAPTPAPTSVPAPRVPQPTRSNSGRAAAPEVPSQFSRGFGNKTAVRNAGGEVNRYQDRYGEERGGDDEEEEGEQQEDREEGEEGEEREEGEEHEEDHEQGDHEDDERNTDNEPEPEHNQGAYYGQKAAHGNGGGDTDDEAQEGQQGDGEGDNEDEEPQRQANEYDDDGQQEDDGDNGGNEDGNDYDDE